MVVFKFIIISFLLLPFSDSCLVCLGFVKKKSLLPHTLDITHPFPTLSHLPSPRYSFFEDVKLPPRLWAVKSLFFPPALPPGMEGRKLNSLDVSFFFWSLGSGMLLFSVCSASTKAILKFLVVFLDHTLPSLCSSQIILLFPSNFAVPQWFFLILLPFLAQKGGKWAWDILQDCSCKEYFKQHAQEICTKSFVYWKYMGHACAVAPQRLWLSFNYLWYRFWNIKSSTSDAFLKKTQGKALSLAASLEQMSLDWYSDPVVI